MPGVYPPQLAFEDAVQLANFQVGNDLARRAPASRRAVAGSGERLSLVRLRLLRHRLGIRRTALREIPVQSHDEIGRAQRSRNDTPDFFME
jgi:hypothetical protein